MNASMVNRRSALLGVGVLVGLVLLLVASLPVAPAHATHVNTFASSYFSPDPHTTCTVGDSCTVEFRIKNPGTFGSVSTIAGQI